MRNKELSPASGKGPEKRKKTGKRTQKTGKRAPEQKRKEKLGKNFIGGGEKEGGNDSKSVKEAKRKWEKKSSCFN